MWAGASVSQGACRCAGKGWGRVWGGVEGVQAFAGPLETCFWRNPPVGRVPGFLGWFFTGGARVSDEREVVYVI